LRTVGHLGWGSLVQLLLDLLSPPHTHKILLILIE